MNKPLISFSNVSKTFNQGAVSVTALDDLSLHVDRHEFVSVLGPSGCGKSTLLRLVAGLTAPTAGKVTVYGMEVTEPRDDVGIVFQKPTLFPWLDVLGNVTFPFRHKYGRVQATERQRAIELIEMIGLKDFVHARIDQLSGGMQQRVGIARALLLDPDILLMDEPFSALDALTRDEMSFELMQIIKGRPKTVLFITHSIPEAVLLSDRIVVMSGRPGSVRETIPVHLPRPRTLETMSFQEYGELNTYIRRKLFSRHAG